MRLYPVGIVGESKYQDEIRLCREGEPVDIRHEPDNPYDDLALRVDRRGGGTIGYVGRSHWLRSAIHEQGRGVAATIASMAQSNGGHIGVVIHVTLTDDPLFERAYQSQSAPADPTIGSQAVGRVWRALTGKKRGV